MIEKDCDKKEKIIKDCDKKEKIKKDCDKKEKIKRRSIVIEVIRVILNLFCFFVFVFLGENFTSLKSIKTLNK